MGHSLRLLPVRRAVAALLVAAVASTAADAQQPAVQAISVNPLYIPFGGLVVEYERAASPGITLGLSGGYYDPIGDDDDSYSSAEAKLRFYPAERALRGFSIGVTAGAARIRDDEGRDAVGNEIRSSTSGATAGVIVDYNWLIGRNRRFFVGTGVGA